MSRYDIATGKPAPKVKKKPKPKKKKPLNREGVEGDSGIAGVPEPRARTQGVTGATAGPFGRLYE